MEIPPQWVGLDTSECDFVFGIQITFLPLYFCHSLGSIPPPSLILNSLCDKINWQYLRSIAHKPHDTIYDREIMVVFVCKISMLI